MLALKLAKHPLVVATGLFTAGYFMLHKLIGKDVNENERKILEQQGTNEEKIRSLEEQLNSLNFFDRYIRGMGSEIEEQIHLLKTRES